MVKTNKANFLGICARDIKREGIDELLEWLEKTDFFEAPASTRFHSNIKGGLCLHSLFVHEVLTDLASKYYANKYTAETIAITSLFHDLCKTNFYIRGFRNKKVEETGQWVRVEVYEVEDKLPLGHGEKSCLILQKFMDLSMPELLSIRWHMGQYDTAAKGGDYSLSKAYTIEPLCVLLNTADILASYLKEEIKN